MQAQTAAAIAQADVVIFMIDARVGATGPIAVAPNW